MPRFAAQNIDHNLSLVQALGEIADSKGITIVQLVMAWVLSLGDDLVPLVGAKGPEQLSEALGALDVFLTPEELEQIEKALPKNAVASERYPELMMAHLDSEKP
jgi:aryl-alcohol dehydrogenase-like predicted oxidoreductase